MGSRREGELGQEYGKPAPLNLRRQIFLSHSGKDKNFVRFLYHALCNRYQYANIAFFDEETLPTGVPVSMGNILLEARQSKLGVLVLTQDFFVHTPNPMRELAEFVAYNVPLLPLFFTISVADFREKKENREWEEKWRDWSIVDETLMNVWRAALDRVLAFSGIEYCNTATNQPSYISKIVNEVTRIIPPAISFSKKGVSGMDRLCKIVSDMYKRCALKRSSNDRTQAASTSTSVSSGLSDVVGIYGFAGLGKTTLCMGLCDFYFSEFNGKVCYLDLGSTHSDQASSQMHSWSAFRKRMEHVINTLTSYRGAHQDLQFSQVQNLLRELISSQTDPVFLAIDNVQPNLDSKNEADFYLNCGIFPRGSKIFITSRSCNILKNLTSFSMVIEHIPKLEFKEAKNIFVHEIAKLCNFGSPNLEDEVNECVNMCIIYEQWSKNYHPLMLKSLATSIRWDRAGDLKCKLMELRSKGIVDKNDAWQAVFNILDITYKDMSEEAKIVFLDLALFYNVTRDTRETHAWIQSVHADFDSNKIDGILSHLQDLTFISMESSIQVHDLLVDFSKYKVSQGIFPHYLCIPHDYLVLEKGVLEKGAHWNDRPRSARSVTISRCRFDNPTLNLRNLGGVEVLHVVDNEGLQHVLLSPSTCAHLRSLIVRTTPHQMPASTSLSCTIMVEDDYTSDAGQQTSWTQCGGLKWVQLEGNIIINTKCSLSSNVLSRSLPSLQKSLRHLEMTSAPDVFDLGALGELQNLEFLTLSTLPVQSIDVKSCAKLKSLKLRAMPSLRSIRGLEKSTILESLRIKGCHKLVALTIPADNYGLSSTIKHCGSIQRLTLCTTSSPAAISPEADCSTWSYGDWVVENRSTLDLSQYIERYGKLDVQNCSNLRNIDGLSQYIGRFEFFQGLDITTLNRHNHENNLEETFRDLLDSAQVDSSICKARVIQLVLTRHDPPAGGLIAGVEYMRLEDAQHIGLLISALFKAQPTHLHILEIHCKEDGDCGCDKKAPLFGSSPKSQDLHPQLTYCCSQVRDLSSLSQWDALTELVLSGCTSVEVWPDFASMTSLKYLDLSHCTSLKEWPVLPSFQDVYEKGRLSIKGCNQLSAEEFMKVITFKMQPRSLECILGAIEGLRYDLEKAQTRASCSIVDALDSHLPELGARFHDAWHAEAKELVDRFHDGWHAVEEYIGARYNPHFVLIELMYAVFFEERNFLSMDDFDFAVLDEITHLLRSIGWYKASRWYKAPWNVPKARTIKLVTSFFQAPSFKPKIHRRLLTSYHPIYSNLEKNILRYEMLAMRVADAMYKLAREPSIYVGGKLHAQHGPISASGENFMHIIQDLEARVQKDYGIYKAQFLVL